MISHFISFHPSLPSVPFPSVSSKYFSITAFLVVSCECSLFALRNAHTLSVLSLPVAVFPANTVRVSGGSFIVVDVSVLPWILMNVVCFASAWTHNWSIMTLWGEFFLTWSLSSNAYLFSVCDKTMKWCNKHRSSAHCKYKIKNKSTWNAGDKNRDWTAEWKYILNVIISLSWMFADVWEFGQCFNDTVRGTN